MVFGDLAGGASSPEDIDTEAEDVVGKDVTARNACEGLSYKSGILHGFFIRVTKVAAKKKHRLVGGVSFSGARERTRTSTILLI